MTPIEQLKSVLCEPDGTCCIAGSDEDRAIIEGALQALAAQPEQEPMSWHESIQNQKKFLAEMEALLVKTSTPQRTWVGLTDEEMETTFLQCGGKWYGDFWKIEDADFHPFLRTIEAKLKEKNA